MTVTKYSVPASAVAAELAACKVTHFVTMPDYVQVALNHFLNDGRLPHIRVVNCTTEDEAVAIALGLHVGGARPILSMQNQGVFACANALLSAGVNAAIPIPILAGQWGRELENLGRDPGESSRLVVRRTEPLLDALQIPYFRVESPADVSNVGKAFRTSHELSRPCVALIGAHMSWD